MSGPTSCQPWPVHTYLELAIVQLDLDVCHLVGATLPGAQRDPQVRFDAQTVADLLQDGGLSRETHPIPHTMHFRCVQRPKSASRLDGERAQKDLTSICQWRDSALSFHPRGRGALVTLQGESSLNQALIFFCTLFVIFLACTRLRGQPSFPEMHSCHVWSVAATKSMPKGYLAENQVKVARLAPTPEGVVPLLVPGARIRKAHEARGYDQEEEQRPRRPHGFKKSAARRPKWRRSTAPILGACVRGDQ